MPVTISDEVLTAAHLSGPELKQKLALTLFQQERLTLAHVNEIAMEQAKHRGPQS